MILVFERVFLCGMNSCFSCNLTEQADCDLTIGVSGRCLPLVYQRLDGGLGLEEKNKERQNQKSQSGSRGGAWQISTRGSRVIVVFSLYFEKLVEPI